MTAYAGKTLKSAYHLSLVSTIHATEAGRNSGINDETQKYINDTEWMLTYESSEVIVNSNYMKGELQRLFGLPYEIRNNFTNLCYHIKIELHNPINEVVRRYHEIIYSINIYPIVINVYFLFFFRYNILKFAGNY